MSTCRIFSCVVGKRCLLLPVCSLVPEAPRHSRASLDQSLVGSLLPSPGSQCIQAFVCALQESVPSVLFKFWWLYDGVNGNLLQEGLCHTQVCCTQSPCPCVSLLLTRTSTGDTQTQFLVSVSVGSLGPEARRSLIEFCQENTLVIANTLFQQHKRKLYTWTSPDGQRRNQIDYILCSQRWRSSIQSAKTRLVADCGTDHELLIAKFRVKLKKVRKTTRPFRYNLKSDPL